MLAAAATLVRIMWKHTYVRVRELVYYVARYSQLDLFCSLFFSGRLSDRGDKIVSERSNVSTNQPKAQKKKNAVTVASTSNDKGKSQLREREKALLRRREEKTSTIEREKKKKSD